MPQDDDTRNKSNQNGGDDPLDFGDFVSRNVQRTADILKGDAGEPTVPIEPTQPPRAGGERTVDKMRDGSYWRRRAAGVGVEEDVDTQPPVAPAKRSSRNRYLPPDDDEVNQFHDENEFGDQGGGIGGFVSDFLSGDGEDGNRNRIIAALIALVLIILIIFGLTRLFGSGGSSDGPVVTPTVTQTVETASTPEGGPADLTTDGTETPASTNEPEIPRGGDNQRGEGVVPESGLAERPSKELTSEAARACSGLCLVRMEGPDQQQAIEKARARASWIDNGVSWLVVSPTQAEALAATHAITFIENDPRTYNLYIVKSAEDHNQRDVVAPSGEIIDATGRYYLVRWNSVPAVVTPVTDWGYSVYKIAPAPAGNIAQAGGNGPADNTNGWTLMDQVSPENIQRIVTDLAGIGELDSSGFGTRYYTYPGNQIAADYLFQELESYGLDVRFEDFIMWDGYLLVNVVAEIPGADDSEVYAMMAHLDSINNDNPRAAPGADDNASGMATTLEVARILAGYQLEHPIRFAFVNAEEVGIVGAPTWARETLRNNVPVKGVFNVDSVGSVRNRPVLITNSDKKSAWMQQVLTRINDEYGLQETLEHNQTDKIVADDSYVRAEGVPSIMIARELFGTNDIHHTLADTVDNVSFGAIKDATNIMLLALWDLAK